MSNVKDLKDLETLINKELRITDHDVPMRINPDIHTIRALSKLSLTILNEKWAEFSRIGRLDKTKVTNKKFYDLLVHITNHIEHSQRWTFWHYFGLCTITSLAYAVLLSKNLNQTHSLQDNKNWESKDPVTAVLAINYFAGILFPDRIGQFKKIIEQYDFEMDAIIKHIHYRLRHFS